MSQVAEAAYGVGDCGFSNPGHHGTPNQRAKAVQIANAFIKSDSSQGKIRSAAQAILTFQAYYDFIIKPDADP